MIFLTYHRCIKRTRMMKYIVFISSYGNVLTFGSAFATQEEAVKFCEQFKTYCVIYEANGAVILNGQSCNEYKKPLVVKPKSDTYYECPKPMMNAYKVGHVWLFGNLCM
jgi:hypothetical protein